MTEAPASSSNASADGAQEARGAARGGPLRGSSPYADARQANRQRTAFSAGGVVAASFLLSRLVELPAPIEPLWKAAGIALLGLAMALSSAVVPAFAFITSAGGDFFLELEPQMLIAGMGSFALAHVFFIAAFAARMRKEGVLAKRWPIAALTLAASLAALVWLWPDLGDMRAPVAAYHMLLTAMVVAAILAPVHRAAPIGAVLFLLSDAVLGLGWFKGADAILAFNWPLYAAAQILLAFGLMRRA